MKEFIGMSVPEAIFVYLKHNISGLGNFVGCKQAHH